jgi:hypothetical protein
MTGTPMAYVLKMYSNHRSLWWKGGGGHLERGEVHFFTFFVLFWVANVLSTQRASMQFSVEPSLLVHKPNSPGSWATKENWLAGNVPTAREMVHRRFVDNPESS